MRGSFAVKFCGFVNSPNVTTSASRARPFASVRDMATSDDEPDDGDGSNLPVDASRHIERMNAERSDPKQPVVYAYLSEMFASPRHAQLTPGLRFAQLHAVVLYYLGLAEDGLLPQNRGAASWKRLREDVPFCDANGRLRSLPNPAVVDAASAQPGSPVASRRHEAETPSVQVVPAVLEPRSGMKELSVARRRLYDEAILFVETQLKHIGNGKPACSRLRAELQYLGQAVAVVASKQHAQLDLDERGAFEDLARQVLASPYMYQELGASSPVLP